MLSPVFGVYFTFKGNFGGKLITTVCLHHLGDNTLMTMLLMGVLPEVYSFRMLSVLVINGCFSGSVFIHDGLCPENVPIMSMILQK